MPEKITPADILDRAASLIEKKGWTKKAFARDANGRSISFAHKSAVCFCIVGAIRCAAKDKYELGDRALSFLVKAIPDNSALKWNDSERRTAKQVIAALRRAAEAARKEAASHAS